MKTEKIAEWLYVWGRIQELNLEVGLKQKTIDEVEKAIQKMIDKL